MKGSRRYARVLAVKGLYHWQVNQVDIERIVEVLLTEEEYSKADANYTRNLLQSAITQSDEYYRDIETSLDLSLIHISEPTRPY